MVDFFENAITEASIFRNLIDFQKYKNDNQDIYDFYKKSPKQDLHCHFSSIIPYRYYIQYILQTKHKNQIYFQYKEQDNIIKNFYVFYCEQENAGYFQLIQNMQHFESIFERFVKQFKQSSTKQKFLFFRSIGSIFYGIQKDKKLVKCFSKCILKYMKENNIQLIEARIKFTEENYKIFYYMHKHAPEKVKFIIQMHRDGEDGQLHRLLKNKLFQYLCEQKMIIGIDFSGEESTFFNFTKIFTQKIIKKMKELQIKPYLHNGEGTGKHHIWNAQNNNDMLQLFFKGGRIGHGCSLVFSKERLPNNILLEYCPISNCFFGIKYSPKLIQLYKKNLKICSDDTARLFFDITDNCVFLHFIGVDKETIFEMIH